MAASTAPLTWAEPATEVRSTRSRHNSRLIQASVRLGAFRSRIGHQSRGPYDEIVQEESDEAMVIVFTVCHIAFNLGAFRAVQSQGRERSGNPLRFRAQFLQAASRPVFWRR